MRVERANGWREGVKEVETRVWKSQSSGKGEKSCTAREAAKCDKLNCIRRILYHIFERLGRGQFSNGGKAWKTFFNFFHFPP